MDAIILPGPGARPLRARANGDRHSIQSVDRALFLLETIAEAGGEATLTELANRTGLNISTCHHLLATLIQRGFAAKVPGRRLYALGARILYLGHACLQVDLPRRAQPYLETINRVTGETVHLAALQGDNVVTLAVREARHAVRVDTGNRQGGGAARDLGRQGDSGLAAGGRDATHSRRRHEALHRQDHHRFSGAARIAARGAPQRRRHRPRRIPARRDLRRRRHPRPGRHGDRRDQRLDADHARERRARGAHARRDQRRHARAVRRIRRAGRAKCARPQAAAI